MERQLGTAQPPNSFTPPASSSTHRTLSPPILITTGADIRLLLHRLLYRPLCFFGRGRLSFRRVFAKLESAAPSDPALLPWTLEHGDDQRQSNESNYKSLAKPSVTVAMRRLEGITYWRCPRCTSTRPAHTTYSPPPYLSTARRTRIPCTPCSPGSSPWG